MAEGEARRDWVGGDGEDAGRGRREFGEGHFGDEETFRGAVGEDKNFDGRTKFGVIWSRLNFISAELGELLDIASSYHGRTSVFCLRTAPEFAPLSYRDE